MALQATTTGLSRIERWGWSQYARERELLEVFDHAGCQVARDPRFRDFLIEAMRQGPGCHIAPVAEAIGVPSATARAWLKRHDGLRFAFGVVKDGPLRILEAYREQGQVPDAVLGDAMESWPISRGLLLWSGRNKALVSDAGGQQVDHEALCKLFGTGLPFKALSREGFLDEGEERAMFRLADRHHSCFPPCEQPHVLR